MKVVLTGLCILISVTCFSQTVKELEYELSYFKADEKWGNKKHIAYKLLEIDSLNERAINYLVQVYSHFNQKDSISLLFDRLINENPKSPKPYLIRTQERNAHYAGLSSIQRINYLKEAYKLDSENVGVIYTLGELYYDLFIDEYKTNKKNLDLYSSNAIHYFSMLCKLNEEYQEALRFPLIQLANYESDLYLKQLCANYKIQASYFPISAFVDLPKDWETNYSVNVISFASDTEIKVSGVESAIFHINWYSSHLNALEEPVLSATLPTKIFRFTWLRTFHNPVVIRLENINDSITLYWKVCDGAGGYEPGEIIVNKSKVLTIKEWNDFIACITVLDFWNLPNVQSGVLGTDGSQWILEGKELGKYHVVDRWSGSTIGGVCLKLLEMTDLEIDQNEIY